MDIDDLFSTTTRRIIHMPVCMVGIFGALMARFSILSSDCAIHLHNANVDLLTEFNAGTLLALVFFTVTLAAYVMAGHDGKIPRKYRRTPGMLDLGQWLSNKSFLTFGLWLSRIAPYVAALVYYHLSWHGKRLIDALDAPSCTGNIVAPYTTFYCSLITLYLVAFFEFLCVCVAIYRYSEKQSPWVNDGPATELGWSGGDAHENKTEVIFGVLFLLAASCALAVSWASLDDKHFCTARVAEYSQIALMLGIGIVTKLFTKSANSTNKLENESVGNAFVFRISVLLFLIMQFSLFNNSKHSCETLPPFSPTTSHTSRSDDVLKHPIDIGTYSSAAMIILFLLIQVANKLSPTRNARVLPGNEVSTADLFRPADDMSNSRLINAKKKTGQIELQFV